MYRAGKMEVMLKADTQMNLREFDVDQSLAFF